MSVADGVDGPGLEPGIEPVHVGYRRWMRWFFVLVPLLMTGVAAAAWRETEASGGAQWLVFVIGLPLVAGWTWWRTRDAAVTVSAAGRIRRRSVTGDQAADLTRLARVGHAPTLSHEDTFGADRQPDHGFEVEDADGARVTIAAGAPWVDPASAFVQVVRALRSGTARTDPMTWTALLRAAGLAERPLPPRLTEPPPDAWGTPLTIARRTRVSTLTPLFALTAIPMAPALMGFFGQLDTHVGRALTSLAGGLVATGIAWSLLWWVLRRGDRDVVTVGRDGRLRSASHRTGLFLLGLRVVEGEVDLTRLTRCQVVPAGPTHDNHRDRPQFWRLELADEAGGQAEVVLHHVRTPPATLLPQLAHHLEANPPVLDAATRRALELRLGRPLELGPG